MHTVAATNSNTALMSKQFSKSKVENLFRHRAGNFYAADKVFGK